MARTFPSAGVSPIDVYRDKMDRSMCWFEGVVDATGTVPGAYILVKTDAARTAGTVKGFSYNVEPGAYQTIEVYGGEICIYAGAASLSGSLRGLFVEVQGFSGGITGDWNALYIYSAPGANPGGTAHCIRIESNPSTVTFQDSFINFVGNPNFTFYHSGQGTAGASTGDKTGGAAGWMNVNMGGATRYIQLYS